MYKVFYPYAGFKKPVIDEQLVSTATDNWGWFWVFLESSFIVIVTTIILIIQNEINYVLICTCVILVEMIFLLIQWSACKRSAKRQVEAILGDQVVIHSGLEEGDNLIIKGQQLIADGALVKVGE